MGNLLADINIGEQFWVKVGVGIGSVTAYQTVGGLVTVLLRNIYVLAGVLLFVLLIVGGLGIIMGAGSGDAKKTEHGHQALSKALIGFLVIFASYWIIQIIQVITGLNILNPQ